MKLLIWIIAQMTKVQNFKYFKGQFSENKITQLKKTLAQQTTVNHSQSSGNGMNQYGSTDWYTWTKQSDGTYFEMRIDNNKYIGGKSRVVIWQWDNEKEACRPKPTEQVYVSVGKYRNGGKPKLVTI